MQLYFFLSLTPPAPPGSSLNLETQGNAIFLSKPCNLRLSRPIALGNNFLIVQFNFISRMSLLNPSFRGKAHLSGIVHEKG